MPHYKPKGTKSPRGRPRILTPSQEDEVVRMHNLGYTQDEIAPLFLVSRTTIGNTLRDRKDVRPRPHRLIRTGKVPEICELYRTGHIGLVELAKRYNTDQKALRKLLTEHGVPINPQGSRCDFRREPPIIFKLED